MGKTILICCLLFLSQLIYSGVSTGVEAISVEVTPPVTNDIELCGSGIATLSASGATGEAIYYWYDSLDASIPIASGNEFVTQEINTDTTFWVAIDSGGVESERAAVMVSILAIPSVNLGNDTTLCEGNSVVLNAGAGFDSYSWSTGATGQTISVSTAGTYSVTVSDGACTAIDAKDVDVDVAISVDIGNDTTICEGNSVVLNAGAGFDSYSWSTGATGQTISVSTTGTYSVTVSDGACTAIDAKDVDVDVAIGVDIGNDTIICEGSNVVLDAGAGYDSYLWNTGATGQTISVSTAGTYSVTVSDGACTAIDAKDVDVDVAIGVDIGNDTTLCEGNSVVLNAGAGFDSYSWSTGATGQTISVSTAGTYSVTVIDGACSATDVSEVSIDAAISVDLGNDPEACAGNTITIDAGSGYDSYIWSTGATSQAIMVSTAGTYSVTVKGGSCIATDAVDVSFDDPIAIDLGNDILQCGGSVTLDAGSGYDSYLWSTGAISQIITTTIDGNYSITVTKGACTATDNIALEFDTPITLNLGSDITACYGGTVVLNAGSGYESYLWSTGASVQLISVTTSGTYSLEVKKGVCQSSDTINVTFGDAIYIDLGDDVTSCEGSQVMLDAGMGYDSYLWSTGETTQSIAVNDSGDYSVEVTSADCYTSDEINVSFDKAISVNLGADQEICESETTTLDGGSGYNSYYWNTGETSQSILVTESGTYSIFVSRGACTATDTVSVSFGDKVPLVLGGDINACGLDYITLDAGSGFNSYLWSNGETSQSIIVSESGNYSVEVQYCGLTKSDEIKIAINPIPEVFIGNDTTLGAIQELYLDAGKGFKSYLWNTGEDNRIILISGLKEGDYEYSVIVTDENDCSNSDTIKISVSNQTNFSETLENQTFNVFPNPSNESLFIQLDENIESELIISIYSSSGKLEYQKEVVITSLSQLFRIDISSFEAGIYFLKIYNGKSVRMKRFIKD